MLAAVKPTVGRISRYGVIPITADQDTAGPMAKTVTDAAIMLGALESAAPDPQRSRRRRRARRRPAATTRRFLKPDGLKGARIGIPRAFFYDDGLPAASEPCRAAGGTPGRAAGPRRPGGGSATGLNPEQARVMTEAIEILKQQGAVIVDPADIPERRHAGPGQELPAVGAVLRAEQRARARTRTARWC